MHSQPLRSMKYVTVHHLCIFSQLGKYLSQRRGRERTGIVLRTIHLRHCKAALEYFKSPAQHEGQVPDPAGGERIRVIGGLQIGMTHQGQLNLTDPWYPIQCNRAIWYPCRKSLMTACGYCSCI